VLLAESGGERLLGKAREIANSLGCRVVAVCSEKRKNASDKFVQLGADEVITYGIDAINLWARGLAQLIDEANEARFVILPSNIPGNIVFGILATLQEKRIGAVMDNVEFISEIEIGKTIHPSGAKLAIKPSSELLTVCTVKLSSVSPPYGDPSRHGKVRERIVDFSRYSPGLGLPEDFANYLNHSRKLTILIGKKFNETNGKKSDLALIERKYDARLIEMSGRVQVVYGPCLAIEVESRSSELPEFHGDLISLNSREGFPIQRIADSSFVSADLNSVIEELSQS